jgi:magnesium transporter
MAKRLKGISKKAGLPPGVLIHIGNQKETQVKVTVIDYNKTEYHQQVHTKVPELSRFKISDTVTWINVDGIHDIGVVEAVGKHFDLHNLLLEDVLNTQHRPKIEEFEHCVFVALKMLGINETRDTIVSEQVSLVLGENWVISFQEQEGDLFDGLRQRLQDNVGVVRSKGADYLMYRLIDTIVDNYFFVTEYISDTNEELEERVMINVEDELMLQIQRLRKRLIKLRKAVVPLREVVSFLYKDVGILVSDETSPYLRDVYEHVIQVNESIEVQREILSSVMDLYLSNISHRMNQVMQVLTIIATIFIPLTFVAGIYGMNFAYMPELQYKYGYFVIWGIMILIALYLIRYFRKRRWL